MYPGGFGQLVEGWTKNMAAGAGATGPMRRAAVVMWVGAGIAATAMATGAVVGRRPRRHLAAYGLAAGQVAWMARRAGRFRWWAVAGFPGPLAFFVAVFASSVLATARGRVEWRGRSVAVGRRARRTAAT
jgi:4,4'-diaponeurosporenoate glycosyltransferase